MVMLQLVPQVGVVLKIESAAVLSRWGGSASSATLTGGWTGSASANKGGGGGGSAPAPAPAAPQGGGNSGGIDWDKLIQDQKPIGNHGCNPDGSCGIG